MIELIQHLDSPRFDQEYGGAAAGLAEAGAKAYRDEAALARDAAEDARDTALVHSGAAATSQAAAANSAALADAEADAAEATRVAIQAQINGFPGSQGQAIPVATRAVAKAVAAPVGLYSIYDEDGHNGDYQVIDYAANAASVDLDTANGEGIYFRSAADPTKAFKRIAPLNAVFLEWWGGKGDGLIDNVAALAAATALLGRPLILLQPGTYAFSSLVIPTGTRLRGMGRGDRDTFQTKILITGDGGGAADRGVNGGVQWFSSLSELSGVAISYNNPALECLVNMSQSGSGAIGRNVLEQFELTMESNITAATSNATALFLGNLIGTFPQKFRIRSPVGFKRDIVGRGFLNGCHLGEFALGPHAEDIAAGVFHAENAQIDIDASTQAFSIGKGTFEGGRNCIKAVGQGTLTIEGEPYMADVGLGTLWLPNLAVAQGAYVCPSVSGITADTTAASADLTNVSATASLFVGLKLSVPGAGAAGAVLGARITAISGTTVTLDTAASTAVVGAAVYYDAYAGHGYVATVAGNTGAAPPAWPVAAGGTVVDGTVTWREMGPCAWLNLNTVVGGSIQKDVVTLRGGIMFNNICGICAVSGGASRPINVLKIGNVNFSGSMVAGHFDGVKSLCADAISFGAYSRRGFNILNSTIFIAGTYNSASTNSNRGADLVIGSGTVGAVHGSVPPVGTLASMVRYNGGRRVRTAVSTGNLTPTFDDDTINYVGLPTNRTINNPTGTAVEGKEIIFRIRDNGTNRNLTWGTQYRAIGVALPAATTANKLLVIRAIYNAADVKWDVISVQQEA